MNFTDDFKEQRKEQLICIWLLPFRGELSRMRARKVQSAREKTKESERVERAKEGRGHGDGNRRHRGGRTKLFDVLFVSALTEVVV